MKLWNWMIFEIIETIMIIILEAILAKCTEELKVLKPCHSTRTCFRKLNGVSFVAIIIAYGICLFNTMVYVTYHVNENYMYVNCLVLSICLILESVIVAVAERKQTNFIEKMKTKL